MKEFQEKSATEEDLSEDPKAAFLRYLAEAGDRPIDESVITSEANRLRNAEKDGFVAPLKDEPSLEEIIDSFPSGDLFKTKIPPDRILTVIQNIKKLEDVLREYLLQGHGGTVHNRPMSIDEIQKEEDLPLKIKIVLRMVDKYIDIDPSSPVADLPNAMNDFIKRLDAIQTHHENAKL